MIDQCENCKCRGNMDLCLSVGCNHHESWYAGRLQSQLAECDRTILEQQVRIIDLAKAVTLLREQLPEKSWDDLSSLEAHDRKMRIKCLEDAAEALYDEYGWGTDRTAKSLLRMADELKEKTR